MTIIAQPFHKFQDGDTYIAAQVEGDTLVIASTRNEENAAEGQYGNLITVIKLADAIAIAKAVLAQQDLETKLEEEAAYEAWLEEEFQRRQDYLALVDSSLEHDVNF